MNQFREAVGILLAFAACGTMLGFGLTLGFLLAIKWHGPIATTTNVYHRTIPEVAPDAD